MLNYRKFKLKPCAVILKDIQQPSNIVKKHIPSKGLSASRIVSYRPKKLGLNAREMVTMHQKFSFDGVPAKDRTPTIECEISENLPFKVFFDSKLEIVDIVKQSHTENVHVPVNLIKHLTYTLFEKLFPNAPKNNAIIEKLVLSIYYSGLNILVPNNDVIHQKIVELFKLPPISD